MEKLTVQEEEVMQRIWQLRSCTVKQILGELDTPPPPHIIAVSVVNNLKHKGFVDQEQRGDTYVCSPAIPEEKYKQHCMPCFVRDYFSNSFKGMVSFFVKEEKLPSEDLQDTIDQVEKDDEQALFPIVSQRVIDLNMHTQEIQAMLIYLVKVNTAPIPLHGFYQMFRAKDTFFGWRKGLLLDIYTVAFLVPLTPAVDWLMTVETPQGMVSTYRQVVFPELTIGAEKTELTWMNVAQWIYIGGVVILLFWMLMQVDMIMAMVICTKMREIDDCRVHITKGEGSPSSSFQ